MKKMMFLIVGLFSVTQVMADPIYRPYATCTSPNHKTNIEIMQNIDPSDASPFKLSITRDMHGNKISLSNQAAIKVPMQRKDILEVFQSAGLKASYGFDLMVSTMPADNDMDGEYKALFTDVLGPSVVYCSHHITFGN